MTTLPGLLLLHGLGDDGTCWGPFVGELRRRPDMADLQVLTPHAPAHGGRLAGPGQSLAWPDLRADAIRNAEALSILTGGPIVAAGHSMGAIMALGVAATRPDLVAATFLEDPPLGGGPPPGADPDPTAPVELSEYRQWFTDLQSIPFDQLVADVRAEHPAWAAGEYEPWARSKQAVDLRAFAEPIEFVHSEVHRLVQDAPAPVVVVAGLPELGGLVTSGAGLELAARPGWTLHRVPTGHDVRRDAPDVTVDLLADLMRSVAR